MNDLTPNDLSHLSDKEFNALCPQGHHAPGAEPRSPAAQAVLDAFWKDLDFREDFTPNNIAAALRAAADQVVPASLPWHRATCNPFAGQIRTELLAIATELEGQ